MSSLTFWHWLNTVRFFQYEGKNLLSALYRCIDLHTQFNKLSSQGPFKMVAVVVGDFNHIESH